MTDQPQRVDAGPSAVSYSLLIQAPAEALFAVLADPHQHHLVDGSDTVRNQAFGPHRLQAGDRFSVRMRKFGVPYRLPLRVTQAVAPGESHGILEWRQPTGHRWRWEFEARGPQATLVTETYDDAGQVPPVRGALRLLKIQAANAVAIRRSLTRLASHSEHF